MDENIDILIAKALANEATAAELAELDAWKQTAEVNMEYFRTMERIFNDTPGTIGHINFNTDVAWQKVRPLLVQQHGSGKIINLNKPSAKFDFVRIAAMLLIVAGFGFAVYKVLLPGKKEPVIMASGNEVREIKLPDSTGIVMNRNTTLAYKFSGNKRKVELKGEAFFDLASDPSRPFEVVASEVTIRDIGTSFNVRAIEGNDSMVVYVAEGEVIMTTKSNKSLVLKKGQEALYLKSRDEFIRSVIADTNATAYKTRIFVFENATLEVVVGKLNDVYNSGITISDEIKSCRLTATFKDEQPDAIIEIIAETLQLKVVRNGGTVTLEGSGCNE